MKLLQILELFYHICSCTFITKAYIDHVRRFFQVRNLLVKDSVVAFPTINRVFAFTCKTLAGNRVFVGFELSCGGRLVYPVHI